MPRSTSRRPPAGTRRPGLLLATAAAGAGLVAVLTGAVPGAPAGEQPVSVAAQLDMTAQTGPTGGIPDLALLEQLAASRSSRQVQEAVAQQAQAAADQAVLAQQQAELAARDAAEAAAAEAAEAAAEAAAAEAAAAEAAAAADAEAVDRPRTEDADAGSSGAAAPGAGAVARISNSRGAVRPQVQAAADQVVSHVPGADGITLGGTRASATDPGGHPSGLALDYMVLGDDDLGDAIAQYHRDHWDSLGVEYVIWQQRMLSSPGGSWQPMADRGSATENHYDHVHVNYRG